jgi:hypothetical protein
MKSRIFLLILFLISTVSLSSYAQKPGKAKKITINGTVTANDKSPVTGAYVFLDGKGTGVITDQLGRFKLKASSDDRDILVAAPGKGFALKPVAGIVDFVINNPTETFPDYVAKYIADNPVNGSGKLNKPKKMNTYNDIYQMIRQEVPGVLVSGKSIVVQQPNSFFGGTTPLFVVNGVRVASIDHINPLEVKSIQLLKGSYANIYGDEGANGVISITLLSGGEK